MIASLEPIEVIGAPFLIVGVIGLYISGTRGPRVQAIIVLTVGLLLLGGAVAQQAVKPSSYMWVLIAIGAAVSAVGSALLWMARSGR